MFSNSPSRDRLVSIGVLLVWCVVGIAHFYASRLAESPTNEKRLAMSLTRSMQSVAEQFQDCLVLFVVNPQADSLTTNSESATTFTADTDDKGTVFDAAKPMIVGGGVIVDPNGTILTSRKVLETSQPLMVQLASGTRLAFENTQKDATSGLATVQIKAKNSLTFAKIGNSDLLEKGDFLVGVGYSPSQGTVARIGDFARKIAAQDSISESYLLDTNVPLQTFAVGMPVATISGSVVGIIEASPNAEIERQIIAVNSTSSWFREQLGHQSSVAQKLGIRVEPVTQDIQLRNRLGESKGAVIAELLPNTPGTRSGFQVGDVILMLGDQKVRGPADLNAAVEQLPQGLRRPVEIVRDGWRMTLQLQTSHHGGPD